MYRTIICAIAAKSAVSLFESAVKAFDALFERPVFFGDCVVIGQSDNLCDEDIPVLLYFKLLRCQRVGTVSVSNESQCFSGKLFKLVESHAHGKDAGANVPGSRDLITKDGAGDSVSNEPDISFNPFDLDVGLVSGQFVGWFVIKGINKRTHEDGGCLGIVVDHGMRDVNSMDVLEGLCRFPKRKTEVYPIGEAESHDMGVVLLELEGSGPFGELVEVHVKEVDSKLPVNIPQFVFPAIGQREIGRQLLEITLIERAVVVDALMFPEMFPVFDRLEGVAAVGTLEF